MHTEILCDSQATSQVFLHIWSSTAHSEQPRNQLYVESLCQVMSELNIKHNISSVYHPESQGTLERFHQTLKSMLCKFCPETNHEWEDGIPLLLFAVRETVLLSVPSDSKTVPSYVCLLFSKSCYKLFWNTYLPFLVKN